MAYIRHVIALVGACSTLVVGWPSEATDDVITMSTVAFDLDESEPGGPVPLIYVQGKLAGIAPGAVEVPIKDEGVVVEIGVPQIRWAPLYSFVVGSGELKKGELEITTSSLEIYQADRDNIWSNLLLKPNTKLTAEIKDEADNTYRVSLPKSPYLEIAKFWRNEKIAPYDRTWSGDVPLANDSSTLKGTYHLVFNQTTESIDFLWGTPGANSWSGAVNAAWTPGLPISNEHWIVRSSPARADVYTDKGRIGSTVIDENLEMSNGFFVVVHLKGHLQGTYSSEGTKHCEINRDGLVTELICTLPPVTQ